MAYETGRSTDLGRGLMGAALGAAFNILVWIVIGHFNVPGSISGWICALIAIYLFEHFGGKVTKKAAVWIGVICAVFLLIANYVFWSWQITVATNAQAGGRVYSILYGLKTLPSYITRDPEFAISCFIRDIIVSFGFCAVGMVTNLVPKFRKEADAQADENAKYDKKYLALKEKNEQKKNRK